MENDKRQLLKSSNEWAAVAVFFCMTLLVLGAVVLRYFFSITFRWSDELTRFIFIYLVFLGIPIALRCNDHIRVEYFTSFLPQRARKWLDQFIYAIVGLLVAAIIFSSEELIFGKPGSTLAPGLQIPRGIVYFSVPLGFLLVFIELVCKLIKSNRR